MRRPQPIVLLVVIFLALGLLAQVVPFYTDLLWFGEVGYASVFWTTLSLQGGLFTVVTVAVLVFLWGNLTFAAGETTKQITVNVNGDTLVESDENFLVNLTANSPGTLLGTFGGVQTVVGATPSASATGGCCARHSRAWRYRLTICVTC